MKIPIFECLSFSAPSWSGQPHISIKSRINFNTEYLLQIASLQWKATLIIIPKRYPLGLTSFVPDSCLSSMESFLIKLNTTKEHWGKVAVKDIAIFPIYYLVCKNIDNLKDSCTNGSYIRNKNERQDMLSSFFTLPLSWMCILFQEVVLKT